MDVLGTPFFVSCTPADVSDDEGFVQLVKENLSFFAALPVCEKPTLTILCDSGYNKASIEKKLVVICPDILSKVRIEIATKMSPTEKQAEKQAEKQEKGVSGFVVVAKRWIVERSNAWREKCRLLGKNCECKLATSVVQIKLCFIRLLVRRRY